MTENLNILSGPAVEPVAVSDMQLFVRVDSSAETALLGELITAARMWVEAYLKKSLVNRQYQWVFDYFPNRVTTTLAANIAWENNPNSRLYPYTQVQVLYVPKPPLVSVDSIQYYDSGGTLQSLDPSDHTKVTVITGTPGRLAPAPGAIWANTQDRIGAIIIEFTAGAGNLASDIPANEILAIKQLAAYWYRNREAASDKSFKSIPLGVKNLLNVSSRGFYV